MLLFTENGNINPSTNPSQQHQCQPPHPDIPSAIYGGDKNPREDRKLPTWKNVNYKKTQIRNPYPPLLLHKIEVIVHLDRELDLDLIDKFAKDNYNKLTVTENTGEIYYVRVYKETEGESLTILRYHNSGKYKIQFVTHKTQRLLEFKKLLEYMGVNTVYKFYFEVYMRYHERHERKVESLQEATLRQYGKRQKIENHVFHGKKIAYMNIVLDIEYKTYTTSVKSYRHEDYRDFTPGNPEYHPKLELVAYKKDVNIEEINLNTIKTIAILLNTIVDTLKLTPVYGEYERQQEQIVVYGIDTEFKRIIKGVKKKIKAIQILDREYHDIRIAIADLLVNKKLKITDIAHILGVSRIYVHKKIEELIDMEVIKRVGRGKYEYNKSKPEIVEIEKREIIRHYHVKKLEELVRLVQSIRKEHKLIRVNTKGTIYIDYETEYERVRLITNVIANSRDVEIIDPITREKGVIFIPLHKLQTLLLKS